MSDNRTRTFSWQDPTIGVKASQAMSGLEYLQAMGRGELPGAPIGATLAFDQIPIEVEAGKVTFFFTPEEYHYNPIGSVHGGVISTLLDSASACAVHTLLPAGTGYTTLELKVNFVRAIYAGSGVMHCTGTVINLGRRTAVAEAKLFDAAGKLYAHCTQTCLIFAPESKNGAPENKPRAPEIRP